MNPLQGLIAGNPVRHPVGDSRVRYLPTKSSALRPVLPVPAKELEAGSNAVLLD
jgi:hypothetical protein